jgi:hypothetical protein
MMVKRILDWLREHWWFVSIPFILALGLLVRLWYIRQGKLRTMHSFMRKHEPMAVADDASSGLCACGSAMGLSRDGHEWREIDGWINNTGCLGCVALGIGVQFVLSSEYRRALYDKRKNGTVPGDGR